MVLLTMEKELIYLYLGRKGLGLRPPPPPPLQEEVDLAAFPAKIDPYAFRSRQQQEYEEKKAEGQLGQARKTTIELDEREERGVSGDSGPLS